MISTYQHLQVVELAPHHYSARLQLSKIMRSLGRPEDALLALAQVTIFQLKVIK